MTKLLRASLVLFVLFPLQSLAIPIDMNDFFADPTVTVAADGSSASFLEEPGFAEVFLANDPGLGDPEVILASAGMGLFFDYDFVEAAGEMDSFFAYLLDGDTGFSIGSPFEFFIDTSSLGTVSFDLTSLAGTQIGLVFSLQSGFADTGVSSSLSISNVRIDPLVATVPEPLVFVSMLIGLGMFVSFGWMRNVATSM